MFRFVKIVSVVLVLTHVLCGVGLVAQEKYQSADEAWRVGVAYYNSRNYAASREPFEAALKMATNDKFRLKVNEALIASYRLLAEPEKMFGACEYVIENSESAARRSLVRRTLISFAFQRGKIDELVKRHEERLKKNGEDGASLYILEEIYSGVKSKPQKAIEYKQRLFALAKKQGEPVSVQQLAGLAQQYVKAGDYAKGAELYEQAAGQDESLAAWHWKEAAAAWLKGDEKGRALNAAKKSHASSPENRGEILAYYWHKSLADIFLENDEANLAIEHYKKAIKSTKIKGYIESCEKSLKAARAKTRK